MDASFWFNMVQNLVLLATLLLVYRQLRQSERAIKRDALYRAVEDHDRLNEILLQNPNLIPFLDPMGTYTKWPAEQVNYMTFLTLALGRFERLHSLRCEGYVNDDYWNSWVKWVKETWLATKISREIWKEEGRFYSIHFQSFINGLLHETPIF